MRIELKKFGNILTSREAGREALSAFLPTLKSLGESEEIIIDFQGVSVLTPSWADEFIRPIREKYPKKVTFLNDTNPSVQVALRFAKIPEKPDSDYLDLSKITVFQDVIVFDEQTDDKIYNTGKARFVLTFPYSDEKALGILTDHKVKKLSVYSAGSLDDSRLKAVIQKLNQAGIETVISK